MLEQQVTIGELAALLAGASRPPLSRAAISNFVADGMPKSRRGTYPAVACLTWYVARLRSTVQQRAVEAPDGKVITLDDAQRRLTLAKAENEEMTAKERRGELMPLSLHVSEVAKLITVTKGKLLNLPGRMAPRLEGLMRMEIKALLVAAIKQALSELAKQDIQAEQPKAKRRRG